MAVSWSPDGRYVLYVTNNERTSNDIWVLLRDGSGSSVSVPAHGGVRELGGVLADGKWVVFSAADSSSGQP
jgi:Tol biopolymer transport system component